MNESLAEFLAKLDGGMNWIEKRHEREKAIREGAPKLWRSVASELKGCVDSYTSLYGVKKDKKVECEVNNGSVTIQAFGKRLDEWIPTSALHIQLQDTPHYHIQVFATEPRIGKAGTVSAPIKRPQVADFLFDVDDEGVFLTDKGQRVDIEGTAKAILEKFLFG